MAGCPKNGIHKYFHRFLGTRRVNAGETKISEVIIVGITFHPTITLANWDTPADLVLILFGGLYHSPSTDVLSWS